MKHCICDHGPNGPPPLAGHLEPHQHEYHCPLYCAPEHEHDWVLHDGIMATCRKCGAMMIDGIPAEELKYHG